MTETSVRSRLGSQLAETRRHRRWTLKDVARRTGRQISRISEIERGRANTTVEAMAEVGAALGLALAFIPEDRLGEVLALLDSSKTRAPLPFEVPSVFDEVFIDDHDDRDS